MNIWFSSDFHFGHRNIAGPKVSRWTSGYRDFEDSHEMNKTITQTINKYVKSDDILYFLGDFCFGGHVKTPDYRYLIECQNIHLLKGNHDTHILDYNTCFSSINDVLTVEHGKHKFFLSHYAHRIWQGSHKGVIHLYGHSHDSIPDYGRSMDVGIDVAKRLTGEYRPFRIEEIIDIMDKKDIQIVDKHEKKIWR